LLVSLGSSLHQPRQIYTGTALELSTLVRNTVISLLRAGLTMSFVFQHGRHTYSVYTPVHADDSVDYLRADLVCTKVKDNR
jgi:hypothetical protein